MNKFGPAIAIASVVSAVAFLGGCSASGPASSAAPSLNTIPSAVPATASAQSDTCNIALSDGTATAYLVLTASVPVSASQCQQIAQQSDQAASGGASATVATSVPSGSSQEACQGTEDGTSYVVYSDGSPDGGNVANEACTGINGSGSTDYPG